MAKLSRDMKDLKEDVGKAFQGELQVAVTLLKGMVSFFKDHTDAIEKFGKGALVLVGITVAAHLAVVRQLGGAAAGLAAVRAQLARVRPFAGKASGTSGILGRAACVRTLAGVVVGWSRVVGLMTSTAGTPASRTMRVFARLLVGACATETAKGNWRHRCADRGYDFS